MWNGATIPESVGVSRKLMERVLCITQRLVLSVLIGVLKTETQRQAKDTNAGNSGEKKREKNRERFG